MGKSIGRKYKRGTGNSRRVRVTPVANARRQRASPSTEPVIEPSDQAASAVVASASVKSNEKSVQSNNETLPTSESICPPSEEGRATASNISIEEMEDRVKVVLDLSREQYKNLQESLRRLDDTKLRTLNTESEDQRMNKNDDSKLPALDTESLHQQRTNNNNKNKKLPPVYEHAVTLVHNDESAAGACTTTQQTVDLTKGDDVSSPRIAQLPVVPRFNNKQVKEDTDSASSELLDTKAFRTDNNGCPRSVTAARQALHRARSKIIDTVQGCGTFQQQALSLHSASVHPELRAVAKTAGFCFPDSETKAASTASFHLEQLRKIVKDVSTTASTKGRTNDDKAAFLENIITALAPDGTSAAETPSILSTSKLLGLSRSTTRRKLATASKKRKLLLANDNEGEKEVMWSRPLKKRKGFTKITQDVRDALCTWVKSHPNVIHSPIANDTILVPVSGQVEKQRVGKLLLEIPIRELHNMMICTQEEGGLPEARDVNNKVIISDTMLRNILRSDLPQLRKITDRHKQMCGCHTCISINGFLKTLNAWRYRHLRKLKALAKTFREGTVLERDATKKATEFQQHFLTGEQQLKFPKPKDALATIMCPAHECGYPHWNCVLRRCKECPTYIVHNEESSTDNTVEQQIRFHSYEMATKCSLHGDLEDKAKTCDKCEQMSDSEKKGKIRRRRFLTMLVRPIGVFIRDWFLPALELYAFHRPHINILGKHGCGQLRHDAFMKILSSIRTRRDYAEAITALFNWQIQSDHFGNNRTLSIEGSGVEFHTADGKTRLETHSHFSDDSDQNAATTHAHMCKLITKLLEMEAMKPDGTWIMFDETDGCAKQYRCGTALFLMSLLAVTYRITIDRAVGAPGHGKDFVDGLNATDKDFLIGKFRMIGLPEDYGDSGNQTVGAATRISPESMVEGTSKSLAVECYRLCSDAARLSGMKSDKKSNKRETNAKLKYRHYHVQEKSGRCHFCATHHESNRIEDKLVTQRATINVQPQS